MRTKIAIGLLCVAAVLTGTGMAGAQAVPATPKVQLPSGETVWDLSGDWDAFVENYGPYERYGIYPNVVRITQTGSDFSAMRMKDNPSPSSGRAGSPSLRGELETNGFKQVLIRCIICHILVVALTPGSRRSLWLLSPVFSLAGIRCGSVIEILQRPAPLFCRCHH